MGWKLSKLTTLIVFILFTSQIISGQNNIYNEWYTPVRNKFLKIIIKNDSIILTKQSFNLNEASNYSHEGLFKIESKIFKDNEYSFIVSEKVSIDKDLNNEKTENEIQYKTLTFNLDVLSNKLYMSINTLDSAFKDKESAMSFLNSEKTNQFQIKLFNKNTIGEEELKKDFNEITLIDFKKYLQDIIEFDKKNKLPKKYKFNYIYKESAIRDLISKNGYNSIVSGRTIEKIVAKYSDEIEIKKLMEEIETSNKELKD